MTAPVWIPLRPTLMISGIVMDVYQTSSLGTLAATNALDSPHFGGEARNHPISHRAVDDFK